MSTQTATDDGSLHAALRAATHDAHEELDARFGAFDLGAQRDFTRFLAAHYVGLAAHAPVFAGFARAALGIDPPDYPAMLRADLAAQGCDAEALPRLDAPPGLDPAGVAYVVAGSRLGLATLRKRGYWGRDAGAPSAYMEDASGLAIWRALTAWMAGQPPGPVGREATCAAARAVFATFARAVALAGPPQ